METEKRNRLTRKEQKEEAAGLDYFWTFADEISTSLKSRKKFPLTDAQAAVLRHAYNRLRREIIRRAGSGRPPSPSDEVIQKIADGLVWRDKKASVKTGGTLEDFCKSKGTTYKTFWRRWKNKDSERKYVLEDELNQIGIILRLADGEAAKGKQDRTDFERVLELLREIGEKAKKRKSNLGVARKKLQENRTTGKKSKT